MICVSGVLMGVSLQCQGFHIILNCFAIFMPGQAVLEASRVVMTSVIRWKFCILYHPLTHFKHTRPSMLIMYVEKYPEEAYRSLIDNKIHSCSLPIFLCIHL